MSLSLSLSFFLCLCFLSLFSFKVRGCVWVQQQKQQQQHLPVEAAVWLSISVISKDGLFSAAHFSKLLWDVNVCQDVNICLSEVDLLGKICFSIWNKSCAIVSPEIIHDYWWDRSGEPFASPYVSSLVSGKSENQKLEPLGFSWQFSIQDDCQMECALEDLCYFFNYKANIEVFMMSQISKTKLSDFLKEANSHCELLTSHEYDAPVSGLGWVAGKKA